ncbi:spermatogenesis-associated protein 24-like [Saccostrea cucullata]|uniref:spermatogenesis-associated protein 24-like n=1 Tax=Saccostrea cuccullata TaxID=36930 RepID=UPI002ED60828
METVTIQEEISTFSETDSIPSDVLVQRQLQDIILTQKSVIERLSEDVSLQETSLRESFLSRDTYEEDLRKLERSVQEDYVPKEDYIQLESQIEEERKEHAKTRTELSEVTDRLEFALGEIEILTKQLAREKEAFQRAFGDVRSQAMKETSKNIKLESKCSEISKKVEHQEQDLNKKKEALQKLEKKIREKEIEHKKQLTEVEIEKKHEQYISRLMEEQDQKKKTRDRLLAVPKTKR